MIVTESSSSLLFTGIDFGEAVREVLVADRSIFKPQ